MKVDTFLFGSVEVDPTRVITFPRGLTAFDHCQRFMLVHEEVPGGSASFTLQSLDEPALAFQIIEPVAMGFNYELALSDEENTLLNNPAPEDVVVMLVLYKEEQAGNAAITPSLRAPLIINTRARIGLQKIMETVRSSVTISNLANPV